MKHPFFLLSMTMSFLTSFAQQSNDAHRYPLAPGVVMKSGTTSDERGGSINTHRTGSGSLDLTSEKKQENSAIYYLSDTAATRIKSYTKKDRQK